MSNLPYRGEIYVIAAPSGTGKTSLVKALTEQLDDLGPSVSHTTRAPRPGEEESIHYQFVDHDRFRRMIERGDFLEHAEVYGNYYGTSHQEVNAKLDQGTDVLLDIDWQGARQVKRHYPDAHTVFIIPPSREALLQRLQHRGQDSDEVIAKRMLKAIDEMSHHDEFDYLIINDVFDEALADLVNLVASRRLKTPRQGYAHRLLLKQLLDSTS